VTALFLRLIYSVHLRKYFTRDDTTFCCSVVCMLMSTVSNSVFVSMQELSRNLALFRAIGFVLIWSFDQQRASGYYFREILVSVNVSSQLV